MKTRPKDVSITFDKSYKESGAITHGSSITFGPQPDYKETGTGLFVHELVHVVQGMGRQWNKNTPLWLSEGMADYVRYIYEPHGAHTTYSSGSAGAQFVRYDRSYGVTAQFLLWVAGAYDKDIVPKLTAACRQGNYSDKLWKQYTGHTVEELNTEWKAYVLIRPKKRPILKHSAEELRAALLQGPASPEKAQ